MPKTSYITMDGDLVSEINPTSRLDYKRDPLGSTTGTVNSSSVVENQYRYKPYGAKLSKSGTGSDPAFLWVGALGYRQTQNVIPSHYVRARHYDTSTGSWSSMDRLWPTMAPFAYGGGSPGTVVDPSGNDLCCDQSTPPCSVTSFTGSPQSSVRSASLLDTRGVFTLNMMEYDYWSFVLVASCSPHVRPSCGFMQWAKGYTQSSLGGQKQKLTSLPNKNCPLPWPQWFPDDNCQTANFTCWTQNQQCLTYTFTHIDVVGWYSIANQVKNCQAWIWAQVLGGKGYDTCCPPSVFAGNLNYPLSLRDGFYYWDYYHVDLYTCGDCPAPGRSTSARNKAKHCMPWSVNIFVQVQSDNGFPADPCVGNFPTDCPGNTG